LNEPGPNPLTGRRADGAVKRQEPRDPWRWPGDDLVADLLRRSGLCPAERETLRVDGRGHEQVDGQVDGQVDEQVDEQLDEQVDDQVDGCLDEQTGEATIGSPGGAGLSTDIFAAGEASADKAADPQASATDGTTHPSATADAADVGLVLGSGLGPIAAALENAWSCATSDIPGFPASTVAGHAGRLLLGEWAGQRLWVLQGRAHLYEGYSAEEVTRPARLLHRLGVRTLILTNASGSLNAAAAAPGDVMVCTDLVNLFFRPFGRRGTATWGRRPVISDPALVRKAIEAARREDVVLRCGVLAGSAGPCYETAAEARAWRRAGATIASMSTVPEALQARELGMRVLVFSIVCNLATGLSPTPLTHEEVICQAEAAGGRLRRVIRGMLEAGLDPVNVLVQSGRKGRTARPRTAAPFD